MHAHPALAASCLRAFPYGGKNSLSVSPLLTGRMVHCPAAVGREKPIQLLLPDKLPLASHPSPCFGEQRGHYKDELRLLCCVALVLGGDLEILHLESFYPVVET